MEVELQGMSKVQRQNKIQDLHRVDGCDDTAQSSMGHKTLAFAFAFAAPVFRS